MKCFYHNDLDGHCAGAVVAHFTGNYDAADYFEVDYVVPLPVGQVGDGEEVYLVDYSFKENTAHFLRSLIDRGCRVVWIDHHTSSMELERIVPEFKGVPGLRTEGISGAALAWMWFANSPFSKIPYAVQLVSDYDCWLYHFGDVTTHFKLGMDLVSNNVLDPIWSQLFGSHGDAYAGEVARRGEQIKQYIDTQNTFYREHFAYESEICGHKCLVVNKKTNSWVFGEKYNQYPCVVVWVFNGERYIYSVFSSDPAVDCSQIAATYGGGGHRGAAGFTTSDLILKKR